MYIYTYIIYFYIYYIDIDAYIKISQTMNFNDTLIFFKSID